MIVFMPEAHTLLTIVQGTDFGIPEIAGVLPRQPSNQTPELFQIDATCKYSRLSVRRLPHGGGEDASHVHLLDRILRTFSSVQRLLDGQRSQPRSRDTGQGSEEER